MKLSKFKFKLPEELIAQYPAEYRDESRLMVLDVAKGTIEHHIFKEIINEFDENDLFVFNDTKVSPDHIIGKKEKTGADIDVMLLRELNPETFLWDVIVEPARKIRIGNKLYFGPDEAMVAEVIDNTTSRGRTIRFLYDGDHEVFKKELYGLGSTPLPRYIKRPVEPEDAERFQTIFAAKEGAIVAPMAGAHFSRELLKRMEIKGINKTFITLHASLSMFRDIDVEDLTKHKMESEQMFVNEEATDRFNKTHEKEHKVCAVGTTVLRALETASMMNGYIKPFEGWTSRFIFPPYEFTTADALISNFQLPFSTMLMNACAFGGYDFVMHAYDEAVKEKYRFGVYGDAILIKK